MEGEETGMVLARASELRSKVNSCIVDRVGRRGRGAGGFEKGGDSGVERGGGQGLDEEEEEVDESLLGIRDVLASLERHLSSLQDLQQQQLYERESTLAEIDRGRMILLSKLKEYKGEDLEVIHEAAAFAGETNMQDDDFLLPPYPRQLPDALVLNDIYASKLSSRHKISTCGLNGESAREIKSSGSLIKKAVEPVSENGRRGMRPIVWFLAKSAFTIIGLVSVMNFAGTHPKIRTGVGASVSLSGLFRRSSGEKREPALCPPGKIRVMEGGESRCVVKERVEIPFASDVTSPNISYGFG